MDNLIKTKSYLHTLLIAILPLGCTQNQNLPQTSQIQIQETKEEVEIENDTAEAGTYVITPEDIEREDYYGYDTIVFKAYQSENGHSIKLEGSKSADLYRISVTSKQGISKKFQIAENWYIASHSYILWDNDNYLFVRFGCGTGCWGGQILSLKKDEEPKIFFNYLYQDSVKNIIIYPDTSDYHKMVLENFDHDKSISVTLDLCEATGISTDYFECYFDEQEEVVIFEYQTSDCGDKHKREISIEQIKN